MAHGVLPSFLFFFFNYDRYVVHRKGISVESLDNTWITKYASKVYDKNV